MIVLVSAICLLHSSSIFQLFAVLYARKHYLLFLNIFLCSLCARSGLAFVYENRHRRMDCIWYIHVLQRRLYNVLCIEYYSHVWVKFIRLFSTSTFDISIDYSICIYSVSSWLDKFKTTTNFLCRIGKLWNMPRSNTSNGMTYINRLGSSNRNSCFRSH